MRVFREHGAVRYPAEVYFCLSLVYLSVDEYGMVRVEDVKSLSKDFRGGQGYKRIADFISRSVCCYSNDGMAISLV